MMITRTSLTNAFLRNLLNNRRFYAEEAFVTKAFSLLKQGANPDTQDDYGRTLLHILTLPHSNLHDRFDEHIKALAFTYKANWEVQDKDGLTPLASFITSDDYSKEEALKLVKLGANPNVITPFGGSLLHDVCKRGLITENLAYIKELVEKYQADIDIKNSNKETPLQCLMKRDGFMLPHIEELFMLIELGADPEQKDAGSTIRERLNLDHNNWLNGYRHSCDYSTDIAKIDELTNKYYNRKGRNAFLNALLVIGMDWNNIDSTSSISRVPKDIMLIIFSFLADPKMNKTPSECYHLARQFFGQIQTIRDELKTPGGFNAFQQNIEGNAIPHFNFFKSAETTALDYKALEKKVYDKNPVNYYWRKFTDQSFDELDQFKKDYAIPAWQNHASLFANQRNKDRLWENIKETDAYKNVSP